MTWAVQVLDLWRAFSRPFSLQLAQIGCKTLSQGHLDTPGGQGVHGPDLLRPSGPLDVLRGAQRIGGKGQGGSLQRMAG